MRKEKGFVEVVAGIFIVLLIISVLLVPFVVRFKLSNEVVSGIAYNTTNNRFISGATKFSVRAGENTPTDETNRSTFCLPPNSPYKDLVNRAAGDKQIKIKVEAKKFFTVKAPWTCQPNVTVTEVK